ncbi:MAG: alpha-E domain-containing protein, partial [Methylobacterium sp.]|nr:alpha-E domain-containing protein [Methylobacterium sp.]
LAERYGRQGPSQRLARSTFAELGNVDTASLFQQGLHEFLIEFLAQNNRLGMAISEQYLQ